MNKNRNIEKLLKFNTLKHDMKKYSFKCKHCLLEYEVYLSIRNFKKRNYKKYCNRTCSNNAKLYSKNKRKNINRKIGKALSRVRTCSYIKCQNCNKISEVDQYHLARQYCSRKCAIIVGNKSIKKRQTLSARCRIGLGWKKIKYYEYVKKDGIVVKLHGKYEVNYASWLDKNDIEWQYEKQIQYIDENGLIKQCFPDFYLPATNEYHDTKGWLTDTFKRKIELIKLQKNIDIVLITKARLAELNILPKY